MSLEATMPAPVSTHAEAGRLCEVLDVCIWEVDPDSGLGFHCAGPSVGTPGTWGAAPARSRRFDCSYPSWGAERRGRRPDVEAGREHFDHEHGRAAVPADEGR